MTPNPEPQKPAPANSSLKCHGVLVTVIRPDEFEKLAKTVPQPAIPSLAHAMLTMCGAN